MIEVMFVLFSISNGSSFWSVNHTSIYKNAKLKVFVHIKSLAEISKNSSNTLLGINISKNFESCS